MLNCECSTWGRDLSKLITKHHRNCKLYDPEGDAYELIYSLLESMRTWGSFEDGIPEFNDIANNYDRAAAAIGEKTLAPAT